MQFVKCDIEDIFKSVRKVFSSDEKLCSTYHILAGRSMNECIEDTINKLTDANNTVALSCYVCEIGFVVFFGKTLYSFGIIKDQRTEVNKTSFFKFVKSKANACFLWDKNQRAIRYLQSIGFKKIGEKEFENNKIIELCQ